MYINLNWFYRVHFSKKHIRYRIILSETWNDLFQKILKNNFFIFIFLVEESFIEFHFFFFSSNDK